MCACTKDEESFEKLIHLSLENRGSTISKSISEKNQEQEIFCFYETGFYEEYLDTFKEEEQCYEECSAPM